MNTTRIGLIAITLLSLGAAPALAQTAPDLFQQALVKEQAEGDLQGAIALYQRIVREFASDRPLAASALLQLGRCHERLGSQEAGKAEAAYRQVLEEYADQSDAVEQARARLTALERTDAVAPGVLGVPSGIETRRVWAGRYGNPVSPDGGPFPDGRSLVYVDWGTGNLAVRNLLTGDHRLITHDGYSPGYPLEAQVSPNGTMVAYSWARNEPPVMELRIVDMTGSSAPRTLLAAYGVYSPSWSRDGRHVAAAVHDRANTDTEIVWVSVEDRSTISLETVDYPGRFAPRLSVGPAGRFVAMDLPVTKDSARYDIGLVATDGSGRRALMDHPANDRLVGWVPGTDDVLFRSDRSGEWDLWAVRVDHEGVASEPRPVVRGIGEMGGMGFTRDGSLFYSNFTLQYNIAVAPFDEEPGRIAFEESEPLGGSGSNIRPSWSPDGELLAFVRRRPSVPGRGFAMKGFEEVLYVRNTRTGEERALAADIAPATVGGPVWFPDGRSLLLLGMPQERSAGMGVREWPSVVYRVDVATGEPTPLFDLPPD
ncbi:MAG TPA: tetratricopeptide repeat protein, partial [Longimicrobiales bacterium]|nr:tetratricopeptide repeat protein [Longimicrobiales bacterium]